MHLVRDEYPGANETTCQKAIKKVQVREIPQTDHPQNHQTDDKCLYSVPIILKNAELN